MKSASAASVSFLLYRSSVTNFIPQKHARFNAPSGRRTPSRSTTCDKLHSIGTAVFDSISINVVILSSQFVRFILMHKLSIGIFILVLSGFLFSEMQVIPKYSAPEDVLPVRHEANSFFAVISRPMDLNNDGLLDILALP